MFSELVQLFLALRQVNPHLVVLQVHTLKESKERGHLLIITLEVLLDKETSLFLLMIYHLMQALVAFILNLVP